jgi:hypothetical protein
MNHEIAKEWVTALRSGEYQQGRGQLKSGNEFCCLGVLCDLARKQGVGFWDGNVFVQNIINGEPQKDSGVLPPFIRQWADISESTGDVEVLTDNDDEDGPQKTALSEMNDEGMTFPAIAAFIEANVDKL